VDSARKHSRIFRCRALEGITKLTPENYFEKFVHIGSNFRERISGEKSNIERASDRKTWGPQSLPGHPQQTVVGGVNRVEVLCTAAMILIS